MLCKWCTLKNLNFQINNNQQMMTTATAAGCLFTIPCKRTKQDNQGLLKHSVNTWHNDDCNTVCNDQSRKMIASSFPSSDFQAKDPTGCDRFCRRLAGLWNHNWLLCKFWHDLFWWLGIRLPLDLFHGSFFHVQDELENQHLWSNPTFWTSALASMWKGTDVPLSHSFSQMAKR